MSLYSVAVERPGLQKSASLLMCEHPITAFGGMGATRKSVLCAGRETSFAPKCNEVAGLVVGFAASDCHVGTQRFCVMRVTWPLIALEAEELGCWRRRLMN